MSGPRVDARLVVPALPPRHISRPRLLAALDGAAAKPLILVAAGPGAGKTVLLSDWVTGSEAAVAWITVTPADTEPSRFWRLLRAALQAVPLESGAVLLLDLSGITYCDSTGVSVLAHAFRRADAAGATLALAGAAPPVFRLLSFTGLDRLFRSYDSVETALSALTS